MTNPRNPRGRPRIDISALPMPTVVNSRLVWRRADVANFRRVLSGQPPRPASPLADGDKLVTVVELAKRLALHPRTVMRRVAEARALRQAWADNIKADYPPDVRAAMDAMDAEARAEREAAEAEAEAVEAEAGKPSK